MSDAVTIAIIASIGPTLVAIINLIGQQNIRTKVQKIVKQTDGMHAAIVKATELSSHAEGVKDEKVRAADVAEKRLNSTITVPCGKLDCPNNLNCDKGQECVQWEPVPNNPTPVVGIPSTGQSSAPKVG
jgi:hypothetical protein